MTSMNRVLFVLMIFVIGCKTPSTVTTTTSTSGDDPVLFTVDGTPVNVSEFKYIYTKTNADKADFSKASVDEYLDLYKKFKLKVARAREMQLDTIPALISELGGYRRQLADSYLIDKEVTNKLVSELYERTKQDVDISHIMVSIPEGGDTTAAFAKINEAHQKLKKKASWSDVAMEYSDDKSKAKNKGRIGFVTAMFPKGFYTLENASYTLKEGQTSEVLRSPAGYHLVKVNARRPARGKMEIAHILIRSKEGKEAEAKEKIDKIYMNLKSGNTFEDIAKANSEDAQSASKGGYIGHFGINQYEADFETAAFSLQNDGDFSKPVKSAIGWHIIKRIEKEGIQPLKIVKAGLQNKIKNDPRFTLSQRTMISRIKKENNFIENPKMLTEYIGKLDSNFLNFKWKPTGYKSAETLFTIGSDKATISEFEKFLSESSRQRIQSAGQGNEAVARQLYSDFINKECMGYEEKQLEAKYPDFKALMREYEEGILLFEATKMEVWDKASQDSVGLAEFFKTVDGKYKWEKRAAVTLYSVKEAGKNQIDAIRAFAKNNKKEQVLAKFTSKDNQILTAIDRTFEKGRNEVLDKLTWEVGTLSPNEENRRNKSLNFMKVEEILPAGDKSLNEARGYVVADYQDALEKKWIAELKTKFPIVINQTALNNLIK